MIFEVTHHINHTMLVLWFLNDSVWWQEGTIGRGIARSLHPYESAQSSRPISFRWADALQTPDCSSLLQLSWLALYIRLRRSPPRETNASSFSATLCSLQMLHSAPVFSRQSPSCFYHTLSLALMWFISMPHLIFNEATLLPSSEPAAPQRFSSHPLCDLLSFVFSFSIKFPS